MDVLVTPVPAQRTWQAYANCAKTDAEYRLELTVRDAHGETHRDTFFLRLIAIQGDRYPNHGGGVMSADGQDGGFTKSCFVEDGTATGVAVRFRLASTLSGQADLDLNELVWATIGRRTVVDLPQDCTATFEFVELDAD